MKLSAYETRRIPSYEPAVKRFKKVVEKYNDFIVELNIANDKTSVLIMMRILRDLEFIPDDIYLTDVSFSDFVSASEGEIEEFIKNILDGRVRDDEGQKSRE